ncbi:MAG: SH3 domain-containing protein, partial [Clostridiales bacterium]|nr:SH3 domain-containing protein [Clostridiales bacterium]
MNKQSWIRGCCLLLSIFLMIGPTAFAATYETIRPGAHGEHVTSMQRALNSLGYRLTPDGKYGQLTIEAITMFQRAQRLTADGLAGHKTLTALYLLAPAFAPTGSQPAIQPAPVQPRADRYEMGAYGSGVSGLQVRLTNLGYVCGRTDGVFDAQTREAVLSFQRTNKLSADGIAGAMTLPRLYAADAKPYAGTQGDMQHATPTPAPAPTAAAVPQEPAALRLEMGSVGEDVTRLQLRLRELGYLSGAADGKFGRMHRTAVMAFQRSAKLTVDGIAGAKTLARLYGVDSAPSQPPPASTNAPATAAPVPTQQPEQPVSQWALVTTSNGGALNFRSSMETRSNNVIASLAVSTRVEVLGVQGSWSRIRHNAREGYVMSKYLRATTDAPTAVPTATPAVTVTPEITATPTAAPATPEPTATPTEAPPFPRILRSGDTGEDVTKLQQELKALSYDVAATGVFDA